MRVYPFLAAIMIGTMLFACAAARAATPEEEARFRTAVKEAFGKKDLEALASLTCWDRVPETLRERSRKEWAEAFERPIREIQLVTPDPKNPDFFWKGPDDVWYRSNLPVVKHLRITFAPKVRPDNQIEIICERSFVRLVGEKEGKLFLLELAPGKPTDRRPRMPSP